MMSAAKHARKNKSKNKRWSAAATRKSDALDLKKGIFKQSPSAIAKALKRSAEHSKRRKASPFQSAMSMLNFYINRGGKNLSAAQTRKLDKAKTELRKAFHQDAA